MKKALIVSAVVVLGIWWLYKEGKTLNVSIVDKDDDNNNDDSDNKMGGNEAVQLKNEFTEKYGIPFKY